MPVNHTKEDNVKFFLDTADLAEIEEAASWGALAGVTTNPTLYARIGGKLDDFHNHIKRICDIVGPDCPVSAESVAMTRDEIVRDGRELAKIAPNVVVKIPTMVEGLAAGADNDDLVWEYRRPFVGPGRFPAPPWGSVYTARECVIFGESTLALRAWMRRAGINRTTDERTPEDHIGLMLAMLAFLATTHPFYRGLAQLTRASLEGLGAARELSVTLPRFYR